MTFRKTGIACLQFLLLYATWFVLSGKLDIQHLTMGVVAAGLVTLLTADLLRFDEGQAQDKRPTIGSWLRSGLRFLLYGAWLIWNIVKANLQVAYLVVHPKMPIRPGLLRFRTRLQSDFGHIVLANSITLTPGTITVDFKDGTYLVHALVPEAAQSLLEAEMQNKLGAVFGQTQEPPPKIHWVDDTKEGGL